MTGYAFFAFIDYENKLVMCGSLDDESKSVKKFFFEVIATKVIDVAAGFNHLVIITDEFEKKVFSMGLNTYVNY